MVAHSLMRNHLHSLGLIMEMYGPSSMYYLKPVVQFCSDVEPICSMYKMKNIIYRPSSTLKSQDSVIFPNVLEQVNKILQVSSFNLQLWIT